ncbi:MAG: translation initiation factor IF-2 [Bacteroidales bacterium]|nr:translation initiation factor IF-2 [Bacteroidales bacterium]
MSEKKSVRLKQAATEFNIGISTIVEFLAKKGITIENKPTTKIDSTAYAMLEDAFLSEKQKKEKANSLQISVSKKEEIVAEDIHPVDDTEKVVESKDTPLGDIIIKTSTIDYSKEKKEKKEHSKNEKTEKQEEPASKKEQQSTPHKASAPLINVEQAEKIESKDGKVVNILGKIDLDSINTKIKPDKKEKPKKEDRKKDKKKEANKEQNKGQVQNNKPEKKDKKKDKPVKDKKDKNQNNNKEQNNKQPQKDLKPKEVKQEEKKENFIETQYVKLSGPILTGEKVDLSQFSEHKPSKNKNEKDSDSKKKRKRIKTTTATPLNKDEKALQNVSNSAATNDTSKKDKDKKKSKKDKEKNKKRHKVEISSEEIEKQIKDTLARLSPMGKSKTSKHRREKRQMISQQHQEELIQQQEEKKILKVTEFVTANELATMMSIPVTKIIASCMQLGMFVSINQRLDAEALQLIADEFGFQVEFVGAEVVETLNSEEEEDREEDLEPRSPIVTVMGHVDHGKTSLLDYIRKTNVIAGEAGGITQHIGAYEVVLPHSGRKITFLDTPGHEAFTAMRARGAKMTDIAIIVVACDDKIMPQTVEAINHAQAAGVPIIFALNKIDKPGADPERIKGELANMNLLVEDWGGKIQSQEISAKKGLNIDLLLEKVLLEADMLELKGNPHKRAKGTVIESSLDKGRGYIAKILVQDGTIRQTDVVLAGSTYGRVKAMYNERNQLVTSAGPSTPVLLLGLNGAPQAGDTFNVVQTEKEAKDLSSKRQQLQREQGLRTQKHITLDEIGRRIAIGDFKELNIILKADVDGSVEALGDSLLKLSTPEVQVNVIHKSVGQITESDVLLATASNAVIIGFQVRPSQGARRLAEQEQIDIRLYSIIYDAINELKDAIEGMLSPEIKEKVVCNLEVKEVFKISKVGTVAGCFCTEGKINKNTKVRLIRDGIVVYTGVLASLKRFKDEVKEVVSGQDCGLNIDRFNDIKVGDIIEGYDEIEIKRTLK